MTSFGDGIRRWRERRRISQMQLSSEADISQRHLSFLENDRSKPSRAMVLKLCSALQVPRHERNTLLTAAGYAPAFGARSLDADEMKIYRKAVRRLLDGHDPYPGWALDEHWRVFDCNRAGQAILASIGVGRGDDLIAAIFADPTLGGVLVNWEEAIPHLHARLKTETRRRKKIDALESAATLIGWRPDGGDETEKGGTGKDSTRKDGAGGLGRNGNAAPDKDAEEDEDGVLPPVLLTRLRVAGRTASFFSLQSVFNTAEDITLENMRIELFFPADTQTETLMENLAGADPCVGEGS